MALRVRVRPQEQTEKRQLNSLQDSGQDALFAIRNLVPFGVLLDTDDDPTRGLAPGQGIAFQPTETRAIAHGLGRPWRGWMVVDNTDVNAIISRNTAPTTGSVFEDDSVNIVLYSTTATTIKLWVF